MVVYVCLRFCCNGLKYSYGITPQMGLSGTLIINKFTFIGSVPLAIFERHSHPLSVDL